IGVETAGSVGRIKRRDNALNNGEGVKKKKFYLPYPPVLIKEPIIYLLGKKFDIVTNIRGANVSNEMGLMALELEGSALEIDRAVEWLRTQGITVEPIEKNVIE